LLPVIPEHQLRLSGLLAGHWRGRRVGDPRLILPAGGTG
jgi:hypothetical protein